METPAELTDGDQNELRYTRKDHNMMTNPKVYLLQEDMNRKKICYFFDKHVTRLYGSHHITSWVAKNKNKTIFDLVTLSDLAHTVSVIENGHKIWEQMTETWNSLAKEGWLALRWEREQEESLTKDPPKFTKKAEKRENITPQDGIMRGYISTTRCRKNGRDLQVRARITCEKSCR
jgi:hypothetical protein